jgi:transglutaminase-like putative cysteine protease
MESKPAEMLSYLSENEFIDFGHQAIRHFTEKHILPQADAKTNALRLYYAVRDGFLYNPHKVSNRREDFVASKQVQQSEGHCIDKANILAACARAIGVPARLGFANVTNHIGTEKLEKILGTNVLVFHGYAELWIEGKWVKATPAFNESLCRKLKVAPLEFDGENDSVFQEYSQEGHKFMEYLHDYGTFHTLPFELMIAEWNKHYPHFFRHFPSGLMEEV